MMEKEQIIENLKAYFGDKQGGFNLKHSFEGAPVNQLQNFLEAVKKIPENGRLFFIGNGGSFDNASLMASLARECGFEARTPGQTSDYQSVINELGFDFIFSESLRREKLNSLDIVAGISGSGNSPNILKGLSYAMTTGASTYAFGGRDGGKMVSVLEKGNCILAENACMEAIEDTNNFMAQAVFDCIREEVSLTSSVVNLLKSVESFLTESNYRVTGEMVEGILESYKNGGRIFILGHGIGPSHFRSDLRRGATNRLPVRGLNIPELYSVNSYLATANDDGADFTMAAGLANTGPGENDFAVLFDETLSESEATYCSEILRSCRVKHLKVGKKGIDISSFDSHSQNFAITMIGHAVSVLLNQILKQPFKIRQLDNTSGFPPGHKKLGMNDTLELENKYRAAGTITANEVITFSYGNTYAVCSSEPFERAYF